MRSRGVWTRLASELTRWRGKKAKLAKHAPAAAPETGKNKNKKGTKEGAVAGAAGVAGNGPLVGARPAPGKAMAFAASLARPNRG